MPNATFRFGPLSEHECRIVCGYFGSERYFVDGALVQKHWSLSPNGSREFRAVDHLIRIDVSIKFKRVDAAAFVDGQLVASDLFADINERFKRQRRHINIVTALMIGLAIFLTAFAGQKGCPMEESHEAILTKLFSGKDHLYSLLWWSDPKSNVISARSFVINGRDSIPVFSSEAEGKRQVTGSGYEKDLVGIEPSLLAAILQRMDYAILNPGGSNPILFKTCVVKPYAKVGGA